MLDKQCYRSVTSMVLPSNICRNPFPESAMRRLLPFAPLLAPLLSLAVAACGQSNGSEKKGGHPGMGMPPPEVSVVTVEPRSLPLVFEYPGQSAGSREVEVRARVGGILLKRNFAEGGPVKEGQSLYTIDPAQFEAAKARLTEARLNLNYTKVEAPLSGISGRSLRQEGSLIPGPDALLTTITKVDPIWVNFGIPDNEQASLAREVQEGRVALPKDGAFEVTLRRADGSVYGHTGRLNFSDVKVSPNTGTREARAELPNAEGILRPGEFVRVILRGASRPNAITVPQRAVLEGPQGKFVYVVDEKGTAQPRPLEVGDWAGDAWIVNKGVQPGDKVIVEGLMRLGPGAPVRIADASAKPAAQPESKPGAQKAQPKK